VTHPYSPGVKPFIIAFTILWTLCAESRAEPYQVQIVLNFGDQRVFTKDFKDQVQREIGESLQAALGEIGQVQVVRNHALVKTLRTRGMKALDELDSALGSLGKPDAVKKSPLLKDLEPEALRGLGEWKRLEPTKTCFVFIDYVNDQYEIQVRQHDGSTGVNSPLRESEKVSDRQFVGRAAALLMARDFGVVGTITGQAANGSRQVQVSFVGGDLEGPLENWVKKNDILAVVRVDPNSPTRPSTMIPHALVQVQNDPVKGLATCQFLAQEGRSFPLQGARCIKLGTARGPIRLRLLKEDARVTTPEPKVQIQVGRQSFKDEKRELLTTDKEGRCSSEKEGVVYDHVAFVGIYYHSQLLMQVPVPILEEGYFDCRVNLKPDPLAQAAFNVNLWNDRLYEKGALMQTLFEELPKASPDKREANLKKAQESLSQLEEDIRRFGDERKSLAQEINRISPQKSATLLSGGDQRLAKLGDAVQNLRKFIINQEEIIKAANDPKNKEIFELIQKAEGLENQAEFGKALEVYQELQEKLKAAGREDPKRIQHINDLAKVWEPKSEQHRKDRNYVYDSWSKRANGGYDGDKAGLDDVKAQISKAKKALETCKKEKDYLTPLKLSKTTDILLHKLEQSYNTLLPNAKTESDTAEVVKNLKSVIDDLGELLSDITAFLEQVKADKK
jgi:hypothetical protein